jgi:uncharacterized tellurite resistance protein B-like protein
MSKSHLSVLVQLAKVDGDFAEVERNFIYQIGTANGMSEEEIQDVIENPEVTGDLTWLSDDEKFEYIFSIVQLMKLDGKLFQDEIRYCSTLAGKLGYNESVLVELIVKVTTDKELIENKDALKQRVQKFLKKKY